jgi:hypothetical protein
MILSSKGKFVRRGKINGLETNRRLDNESGPALVGSLPHTVVGCVVTRSKGLCYVNSQDGKSGGKTLFRNVNQNMFLFFETIIVS